VTDTGIGISDRERQRLFQPFSQADSSTTRRFGGTGLGLVISQQLVEQMGGHIEVESHPGVGSCFHFRLRLPLASEATDRTEVRYDLAGALAARRGARLLVVEDHEINRLVARTLLERNGFQVETAEDGLVAVRLVREREYACVLMDIQMPNLDGHAATREIRRLPGRERLPILAMSAADRSEGPGGELDEGMDDHITKPFVPSALLETLCRWIPPHDNAPAAPTASPLPGRPILDQEMAIARLAGNEHTYHRLLRMFLNNQPQAVERIVTAIERQERDGAVHSAHALKGDAGNLGAVQLERACRTLEQALMEGSSDGWLLSLAQECQSELDSVIEVAGSVIDEEPPPGPGEAAAPEELTRMMCELLSRLRSRRLDAEEQIHRLLSASADPRLSEGLRQLLEPIIHLDYDRVIEPLEGLILAYAPVPSTTLPCALESRPA